MLAKNSLVITPIHFCEIDTWDPKRIHGQSGFQANYPLVPFSKVLHEAEIEWVDIDNAKEYQILGVHAYGEGVYVNHTAKGSEMTMRRYQKSKANCLFWCKVRTVRGQFGVVYPRFESTYGSSNMKYMAIDTTKIIPQFLELLFQKNALTDYMDTLAIGSNSRHFNPSVFLKVRFPLPSIEEQQALLDKYNAGIKEADEVEKKRENLFAALNNHIFETLGISFTSIRSEGLLNTIGFKRISRWDPAHLKDKVFVSSQYPLIAISNVLENFMVDRNGQSLRRNTSAETNSTYQYIGMENIEKGTGKRKIKEVLGADILSQTVYVPQGYIIYGKLRPYLNKYWENNTEDNNIICSSEFFVFDIQNINKDYFVTILASDIVQKQLPPLYSGARMPRINEDDFSGLQIPLPPENIQIEIAEYSNAVKEKSEALRGEAKSLRQRAKKEFEEAVFGGV